MTHSPKRVVLITALAVAFLVGIWLGFHYVTVGLGVIALAGWLVLAGRRTRLLLPGLILLGLSLGIYRGSQTLASRLQTQAWFGQKITIAGRVSDDPVLNDKGNLQFTIDHVHLEGHQVPGQVAIRTYYLKLQRGYRVEAAGKFEPILGSKTGQLGFATVQITSQRQSWLDLTRQRFVAGMRNALPEPLSSLALGLIMGTRSLIPRSLQDQLAIVGLSHIVAVSGYNLTIIVIAVNRLLARFSKFLAAAGAVWIILGFVALSGLTPSILRASVVALLALAGSYYGQRVKPLTLLSLAAIVTVWLNPNYLISDLGWQLSFLAFFGVAVIAPVVEQRFVKRSSLVKGLLISSLAAQMMTFPLIMITFGRLSVVAPLANLIVLPLIPVTMLVSLIAGLAGMTWPAGSALIGWPAAQLLKLILEVVNWLGSWSLASLNLKVSSQAVWLFYGLTLAATVLMTQRIRSAKDKGNAIIEAKDVNLGVNVRTLKMGRD